jgi:hypothetical protein
MLCIRFIFELFWHKGVICFIQFSFYVCSAWRITPMFWDSLKTGWKFSCKLHCFSVKFIMSRVFFVLFCVLCDDWLKDQCIQNRGLHLCFGNFQFNCNDLFWFSSYEVWNIEFFKSFYNAVLRSESWRKVWSRLCLLTVSLSVLCAVCANVSWLCSIQWWKPGSTPAIPSENIRSTRTRNGELTEIKKSFRSEYQAGD